MKKYIVVLPYQETARLFNASSTKTQEAFVGEKGTVYYQYQAQKFDAKGANEVAISSGNKQAFVREVEGFRVNQAQTRTK